MWEETIRFALRETFEQAAIWRALQHGERGSVEALKHFRRLIATVGRSTMSFCSPMPSFGKARRTGWPTANC